MDKKTLNKAFTQLVTRLEKTEKFVLDQAPDICKQMVREKLFDSIVDLTAVVIGIIVLLPFDIWCFYQLNNSTLTIDGTFIIGVGLVFGSIGLIAASCCLLGTIKNILFIKYCPKLLLLREFNKLI